ncbi:MAG: serine hydrolase [Eubacteriales bacterium]|nr:serine hydrolase [Eubacteriales bacterium]
MMDFTNLDKLLKGFSDELVAGCGCIVTKDQRIVYEGYHGFANIEKNIPISDKTLYRIFSMTKIPIFTACMMLYEQGKLLLTDPLYKFFPEYRHSARYVRQPNGQYTVEELEKPICIKHVLSMSFGMPYGQDVGDVQTDPTQREIIRVTKELHSKGNYSLRDEIKAVANVPVAFEPGSHWMYGFGSELAAGLVELLTGKEIETALREMLFNPLDMKDTCMRFQADTKERLSVFYAPDGKGGFVPVQPMFDEKHIPGPENLYGCPRIITSISDYSKLGRMLANGGVYNGQRILGRKTIEMMRDNQLNANQLKDYRSPDLLGYGYGLGVRTLMSHAESGCNASLGEFGWSGGSGTWFSVDPVEQVSVTYMHQLVPCPDPDVHLRVRNVAYGCL